VSRLCHAECVPRVHHTWHRTNFVVARIAAERALVKLHQNQFILLNYIKILVALWNVLCWFTMCISARQGQLQRFTLLHYIWITICLIFETVYLCKLYYNRLSLFFMIFNDAIVDEATLYYIQHLLAYAYQPCAFCRHTGVQVITYCSEAAHWNLNVPVWFQAWLAWHGRLPWFCCSFVVQCNLM
jgi:hypothetical protein